MPELTEVERVVLRLLLAGDDTTLVQLRDQLLREKADIPGRYVLGGLWAYGTGDASTH